MLFICLVLVAGRKTYAVYVCRVHQIAPGDNKLSIDSENSELGSLALFKGDKE